MYVFSPIFIQKDTIIFLKLLNKKKTGQNHSPSYARHKPLMCGGSILLDCRSKIYISSTRNSCIFSSFVCVPFLLSGQKKIGNKIMPESLTLCRQERQERGRGTSSIWFLNHQTGVRGTRICGTVAYCRREFLHLCLSCKQLESDAEKERMETDQAKS